MQITFACREKEDKLVLHWSSNSCLFVLQRLSLSPPDTDNLRAASVNFNVELVVCIGPACCWRVDLHRHRSSSCLIIGGKLVLAGFGLQPTTSPSFTGICSFQSWFWLACSHRAVDLDDRINAAVVQNPYFGSWHNETACDLSSLSLDINVPFPATRVFFSLSLQQLP